jgi:subtilisin family serine protease
LVWGNGRLFLFVCVVVLVVFASAALAAASGAPLSPYVEGQCLVKFRPGTPASEVARAHAALGSAVADSIPQIGVQVVTLPPGLSVGRAVGLYQHNPNVEFAEPDYYVAPSSTIPNDPYFNYGQMPLQWMGAPEAWDITRGTPSVLIAVLDTGVDYNHPDLQGRLVLGRDFVDGDQDPYDLDGHGTWVTGVPGATTNNGLGIAGVSWSNPVLCVRIGDYWGTTYSLMAKGVTHAADNGARAINISFAGTSYSSSIATAVDYAWNKGAVTIAAAGNSGTSTPYYPAALPRVVAVSGVESTNTIVYYSNYGSWIDVCAPCNSETTLVGGSFGLVGGTSISAPYVTGLFGLVFSANPSLTPQQAVDIVCGTADDLGAPGFDIYYGWGKIDIYRAVLAASQSAQAGDTAAPSVSMTAPAAGAVLSGTTGISVSATDNVGVTRVDLYIDGSLAGSLTAPPYQWTWNTAQASDGSHIISAKAYDGAGNMGVAEAVSVTVDNTAPSAAIVDPTAGATVAGTTPVQAAASDVVTSVRDVGFYLDGAWQKTVSAAPYVWNWDTTKAAKGWHSLVARAYDAAGNEGASSSVSVEVSNPTTTTETFTGSVGFSRNAMSLGHPITVGSPGLVSASLTWSGKADLDLYLYSPAGVLVAASTTRGRGGSEQLQYQALSAGTYTLKVAAFSGKANYTLTATHP